MRLPGINLKKKNCNVNDLTFMCTITLVYVALHPGNSEDEAKTPAHPWPLISSDNAFINEKFHFEKSPNKYCISFFNESRMVHMLPSWIVRPWQPFQRSFHVIHPD